MANESTTWLYEQLKNKGYNVGKDVNEFDSLMHANAQSRQWAYETATNCGFNVGKDIDEFTSLVVGRQQPTQPSRDEQPQANAATAPTPGAEATPAADANTAPSRPRYYKLRRGGRDFTVPEEEVEAAGGLTAWWNKAVEDGKAGQPMGMNLNAPYRVYMHGKDKDGNDFDGHVAMSVADERRAAGYDYTFTDTHTDRKPTLADRKRSAAQLANVAGHNEKVMDESKEWMEDMQEYSESSTLTPKPVESSLELDPNTGKASRTYLTHGGRRMKDKDAAEWEELKYRLAIADSDMSLAAQLRRAYEERDYLISKANARRAALTREDNTPGVLSSIMSSGDAITGATSATTSATSQRLFEDTEYQQYREAISEVNNRIQTLENRRYVDNGGDQGFWRTFGQTVSTPETWVGAMSTDFLSASARLSANTVDTSSAHALKKAIAETDEAEAEYGDFGFFSRAGSMTGYMLPFMLDFAVTGGGFEAINVAGRAATKGAAKLIGREAIQEMATMGVKAYAKQYGAKGVGRMAGNWTIKALGTTADELLIRAPLMTNTVQAGKTVSDIVDRKLGDVEVDEYGNYDFTNDKTWGSAVWQGEANAIIENYSEMFGTHLEGIMPALAKTFGGKRISGMLARANASSFGQVLGTTRKHFQRMGVSDYFGEVSEEYYGQLWRTMLNLDDAKNGSGENLLLDGQFHGDIWGGMALSMGMMGVGKYTMASAVYAEKKHQVSKADRLASEIFTPEKWEPLRDIIDNTTNADMGDLAEQVITDAELTDKEREAALDYMERSLNFRGYNLATTAQSRGAEQDPTEAQLSNSYLDGYNAGTSDEMADAQNMYERQRLRAQERFGLRGAIFMDHNPVEVISQMRQSGASEEDIQLALDFANAKALRDGMIRRVNDNIDEQIAQSDAKIDASINDKSGSIITVVKKSNDTPLYVVSGEINTVQNADGTWEIDVKNSDKDIVVRNSVTGELEFTTPKELYLRDMDDPERVKAAAAEAIRQQTAQSAADAMNGVRYYNVGDVVPIEYYGDNIEAKVHSFLPDGGIIVEHPEGALIKYSREDLQEFAHNADMSRVEEFERARQEERSAAREPQAAPQQKPKPQFKLNDEFTITYQGQPVRGSITGELDEEGKIEIYTEEPTINGQQVIRITPEELEMILESYNGEDLTEPSSEGEGEGGYGADNWRDSRPDDNYGYQRRADIATDRLIDAARQGDEEAAAILAEYGEEIGTPGVYRFARKEEVDALQRGKHYAGRNGNGKVDVTASDVPTSAASGEFRIKFKPDFDLYKVGNGRTRMKNAEEKDGWIMDGYDIADVESIEQLQPDGTYAEVWHADAQAESAATVGTVPPQAPARSRVPVDEQGHPKYDEVDPDTAWDAIVEEAEGDEAIAAEVVADILEDRKAELTAADKALTKAKESKPEKRKASDPQPTMAERIAAKRAAKESLDQAQAARDRAQAAVDRWTKIAESKQRRANERLNAEQAEARRRAEALAQEEARLRAEREEQARKEREALNGVPDWQLDTAADARARGYRRDGAKKVDRPEVMDNYAWGNRVQVKFGDGIIPEGYAVVIEAEQLQPSHLDGKRNPSHFLDEAQPKNRKDGASRAAADRIAREIRPEEITSSVTAFTGAPSINGRGEVIQGNNRGDALRRMYEGYPQSAEKYRQYLIDHAQDFGLTPEAISAFSHPVLVNMLDVTDDEAIHYGQYAAQDTESGGIERIKPKNAVQRMGNEVSTFAALLLRSADDEASFSQLVDDNGVEVLKWMSRKGFISDTQYGSAFDSNGNLSAEAANDLKAIMYQSIFTGGSTRLEETFNKMPAKAQRAILATAFRDNESPESERLLGELQQSVTAFGSLMGFEQFREAANPEAVAQAIAAWKRQTSFDDVSGEAYLPAEKFSQLAIALAALYKSATQKQIQSTFNSIYDLVQGTVESDLFGEADTTKHPLSEAVRRVMGIELAPASKPKAADHEGPASEIDDSKGQKEGDRTDYSERKSEQPKKNPKYDRTIPTTPEAQRSAIARIIDFAKNIKNRVERAVIGGITKRQAKDFGNIGIDIDDTWVHSFESSAVVHNQNQHGNPTEEERIGQIAITPEDYARIPEILETYDRITKSPNRSHSTGNEVIIYEKEFDDGYIYYLEEKRDKRKSLSFQTMYKKKKGTDSSDGLMPVASPSTPTAPSDNLSSISDRKVNDSATDKQEPGEKSSESTTPLMDKIAKGERLDYFPGILDKLCKELAITPGIISEFEPSEEIYEAIDHSKEEIDAMSAEELEKLVPDVVQQIESGRQQALQGLRGQIEQASNADEKRRLEQECETLEQHGDSILSVFVAALANLYGQKTAAEKSRENSRSAADEVSGTTTNPSGNRLVTDERYAQLRERMRKKLGSQLNMGVDPEILAIGAEMAVYHIEKGARKFKAYASAMIADLGDTIRPYLKAFYNAVRDMPEAVEAGLVADMDSYDDVRKVDIANFDKTTTDAMATAAAVVAEQKVEKEKEQAEATLKESRKKKASNDGPRGASNASLSATSNDTTPKYSGEVTLKDGRKVVITYVTRTGYVVPGFSSTRGLLEYHGQTQDGKLVTFTEDDVMDKPQQGANLIGDSEAYQEKETQTTALVDEIGKAIESRANALLHTPESTKPLTMADIKKMALKHSELNGISDTDLQELVELAMTQLTRKEALAGIGGTAEAQRTAYDQIVRLYRAQPSLNARDSERLIKQQYSTPTPFGYVMGQFVRAGGKTVGSMLEPSAGNGALTITVEPSLVHVNDIDQARLANLRKLGYGQVTARDALLPFGGDLVDVVMTNPPFGTVTERTYDDVFRISSLEAQMAINALEQMKDDGRAAIIIGGNTNYRTNGSMNPKDAAFFGYLYSHYNVADVINISGKALYSRNGTGYDVRMILIDGRKTGAFQRVYPPVKAKARAEQITTFDELYKRVQDDIHQIQQVGNQSSHVQREAGRATDRVAGTAVRGGNDTTDSEQRRKPVQTNQVGDGGRNSSRDELGSGELSSVAEGRVPGRPGNDRRTRGLDNEQRRDGASSDDVQKSKSSESRQGELNFSLGNDGGRSVGDGRAETAVRPDTRRERLAVKTGLGDEKIEYVSQSGNGFTLMSVVPAAQARALQKSLGEIGDVDQYLVDELGYSSKDELYGYLAAEQIDSVALAIHQMNKGNAFIIGDMTGVGKGRQGAALIRYAVAHDKVPIYFTQKPTLFTDNYRDLADIGSGDLRPFIIASDDKEHSAYIKDAQGNVIHKLPAKKERERVYAYIMEHGTLPEEYDYVLTTYSQIQNGNKDYEATDGGWVTKPKKYKSGSSETAQDRTGQQRRDILAKLSQGNIAILDESHTVGGDSGCGRYMQMLTAQADGVTFMSATFAKRADNMPIYAQRTAIAEAGVKASELIEAIAKGGVTLQEIMSKQLVESGQMIRRERSFEGVAIDWLSVDETTNDRQRAQFDEVAEIFNAIRNFQDEYVTPAVELRNETAAERGATVGHKKGTKDMGVKNVPFASKMYNLVNQLLFALKVDAVADRVIENLRNGFKPVISFANTMEGFLEEAPKGVAMDEAPTFALTLMRALDGVMRLSEKDADGKTKDMGLISLNELSAEGREAYNAIRQQIMRMSSELPISPMDAIRMKIEAEGYTVGEITGREIRLNRTEDGRYVIENRKDKDSNRSMRDFNSGKLDVLMINKSGSTGISLHASSKFEDQRPRVMVFAQFQSDINDEVQMRGRIDRSGQVTRGRYEYIMSTIPAEQRIQMMFKAKLKSLDANTTSSQKSKFNEMEIVDYLNKYGDEVVWEYMKEHPELEERLGDPLDMLEENQADDSPRTSQKADTAKKVGCAGKISRYLAFLSVEEQDEIFREITEAYRVKIQLLDDAGENDLEITTMPLRAETKSKKIWNSGVNPDSGNAFADNTYVEEAEVDVLKKPMKRQEIAEAVRKYMGEHYSEVNGVVDWARYADAKGREIAQFYQAKADEAVNKLRQAGEARTAKAREKAVSEAVKARGRGQNNFTDEEIQSLADTVANEARNSEEQKQRKRRDEILGVGNRIVSLLGRLRAGNIYVVPQDLKQGTAEMFSQTFGTFLGFKFNKGYTLGSSTAVFATLDGRRKVELALSDPAINVIISATQTAYRYSPKEIGAISMDNWDSHVPTQSRQTRYIITGNLLQALVDTEKGDKTRGNLISYSTIDGETRQGILMGENFKPTDLRNSVPMSNRLAQIREGQTVVSENGDVQIEKVSFGWQHRGQYELRVPKSKQRGGIYTMHADLLALVEDNNFITKGNSMIAYVSEANIARVVDMLSRAPFNLTVLQESKLTDVSAEDTEEDDMLTRMGNGHGPYTDMELADADDVYAKVFGKSRYSKKQKIEYAARKRRNMATAAQEVARALHLDNVEIVTDASALEGKRAKAKGFYNKRTGKITIVIPNHQDASDVKKTVFHEAVAHYGLRKLFGKHFDTFLDKVYERADEEIRRKIAALAAKNGWDFRTATEEYLASLAEDTGFADRVNARFMPDWWMKVKELFFEMLDKLGIHAFDDTNLVLTDNELRYILWRSYRNLEEPGGHRSIIGVAEDVAMQSELKVGNYAPSAPDIATASEQTHMELMAETFDQQLAQYERGELKPEHRFELGMPSRFLLSAGFPNLPISMRASLLATKAKMNRHPFEALDLRGLVEAIQKPIAIFEYSKSNMRNLIVDIKRGDKHFLVGVTLNYKAGDIEINSVSGLFPKDSLEWLKWIQDGKAIRIDQKEKVLAIIASQRTTNTVESERIGLNLDDVAKIVNNFENPTITEDDSILFRSGETTEAEQNHETAREGGFSPRDRAIARDYYNRMTSTGGYQFQEAVQDSMLGLKKLYKAIIGGTRIEDVADFENAYTFENRMSSATKGQQHEYFIRYMQPLLREIGEIAGADKAKRRSLTNYLMAKHGLERNAYMRRQAAENNENTDRDFAGLTGLTHTDNWQLAEEIAQDWVDQYEAEHNTEPLWFAIRRATEASLQKIYLSGLLSKENYEKILGMYQYYIPLRGWDETTSDEVYGYLTSKDGPFGGSIVKKAKGRESVADDPIATIAMMADDAIRQGNRNIMKQRFLNFVLNHPSDLVSVHDLWLQFDEPSGEWQPIFPDINENDTPDDVDEKIAAFEERMEALRAENPDKYKRGRETQNVPYKVVKGHLKEHQVLIKRNGRTYVATINGNPRAAQALNGLTNPDVDQNGVVGNMLKLGTWVNRQLSAFYTTRNPDFVASNFFRDMLYSNCMTWVKESPRYALRFHKNFGRVNPVMMRRLLGKWECGTLRDDNRLEHLFYLFMVNGGETGYTDVRDIESHKRAIAAELRKQGNVGRRVWTALGMQLDLLNRSAENCARFAAFITSIEFGRTVGRAVYDAKEISVNFNKKGSGGKMVNAVGQTTLGKFGAYLGGSGRILYVFWNAGIQGMTNFGRQAKRHPAKFTAGATALFVLGYLTPILAKMLSGDDGDDDDKNAYYNLPEYIRRQNICLYAGEQWISIPLPIEFRAMYGLGELAHGVISGDEHYSNEELAFQMAAQVSQIMPLDMLEGGGGVTPYIPSAAKPFTEAYIMNRDWTGLPVYKDTPFNKNDPEWTKAYASADTHLVDFARWLNEISGGDNYKKGAIDINPAKIEHVLSSTFGGVISFPNKLNKTGETIFGDREFEWRNIPIANRLVKSGDERTANRKLKNEYYRLLLSAKV